MVMMRVSVMIGACYMLMGWQDRVHARMNAIADCSMQPPKPVDQAEPDKQHASEAFEVLSKRAHDLEPKQQTEETEEHRDRDVTEAARCRYDRSPTIRPALGTSERRKWHPMIGR